MTRVAFPLRTCAASAENPLVPKCVSTTLIGKGVGLNTNHQARHLRRFAGLSSAHSSSSGMGR